MDNQEILNAIATLTRVIEVNSSEMGSKDVIKEANDKISELIKNL